MPRVFEILPLESNALVDHVKTKCSERRRYFFLWVENGDVTVECDGDSIPLSGASIVCIGPGKAWKITNCMDCSGKMIVFSAEFFCRRASEARLLQRCLVFDIPVALEISASIRKELEIILAEHGNQDEYSEEIIRLSLSSLMYLCERELSVKELSTGSDFKVTRRFKMMVEDKFREMRSVSAYADIMNVPVKQLTRAVYSTSGITPKQLISERIMLEAKRLLRYCEWSVKEIAVNLGFNEETNFSKFFRQHMGMSPSQFRDSCNSRRN